MTMHVAVAVFSPQWFDLPGKQTISKETVNKDPAAYPLYLSNLPIDQNKSFVYVNNRYAFVSRNPVRLIFYPRDANNNPAIAQISVQTSPQIENIQTRDQDDLGGGIIIDLQNSHPQKTEIIVQSGGENFTQTVYFAPNCSRNPLSCLRNPWYFWWYLHTIKQK
ncbi:hypothetical protein M1403_01435 [Patescibacteria group bacterium]|nr:hypothetical protein [Patescibacteria group bacterium]